MATQRGVWYCVISSTLPANASIAADTRCVFGTGTPWGVAVSMCLTTVGISPARLRSNRTHLGPAYAVRNKSNNDDTMATTIFPKQTRCVHAHASLGDRNRQPNKKRRGGALKVLGAKENTRTNGGAGCTQKFLFTKRDVFLGGG